MNCEDISRLVDSGDANQPASAQLRAVEAHARACRRCAAVWSAHTMMASMSVPPMPEDVGIRCRTQWAAPSLAARRAAGRRFVVVGGIVAMAAAAGVLGLWMTDAPRSGRSEAATATTVSSDAFAETIPATSGSTLSIAGSPATDISESAPAIVAPVVDMAAVKMPEAEALLTGAAAGTKPATGVGESRELPLLPRPVSRGTEQLNMAFDKVLERYPELLEGPVRDDVAMVAMVMREDGTVLTSTMRRATPQDRLQVDAELQAGLPQDGMGSGGTSRRKSVPLPDGRVLRSDVSLRAAFVPDTYDLARSSMRVAEILGDQYADLMRPAGSPELSRVLVLLTDAGRIQRAVVAHMSTAGGVSPEPQDAGAIAALAEQMAAQLEVDVGQIGLIGNSVLQRGTSRSVRDPSGNFRMDDQRELVLVRYAWPRREGEAGPTLGQRGAASQVPRVNVADALIVVESVLPDAFAPRDPARGEPNVVLTAEGKVIQAGWVRVRSGEPISKILQDQLVPGVETSSFSTVTLTNKAGVTIQVSLAWEAPRPATR